MRRALFGRVGWLLVTVISGGCGARDLPLEPSPVRGEGAGGTLTGTNQVDVAPSDSFTAPGTAGRAAAADGAGGAPGTMWSGQVDSEGRVQTEGEILIPDPPNLSLVAENEPVLQQIKAFLEEHPEVTTLRIEGHTDDQDTHAHNLDIAGHWARAVKQWLIDRGVSPERLLAVSFGETRPRADNATDEGRAQNRRIEFYVAAVDGVAYLGRPLNGPQAATYSTSLG